MPLFIILLMTLFMLCSCDNVSAGGGGLLDRDNYYIKADTAPADDEDSHVQHDYDTGKDTDTRKDGGFQPDTDSVAGHCGNGVVEGSEKCEPDQVKNCTSIDSSKYEDGKAACREDCSGWDTDTCELKAVVSCTVSDSMTTPDSSWKSWFTIKAFGVINNSEDNSQPTSAFQYKQSLNLTNNPSAKLTTSWVFYSRDNISDSILLYAAGDPGTTVYQTFVVSFFPIAQLSDWKQHNMQKIADGVKTLVYRIKEYSTTIIKQCVVAAGEQHYITEAVIGNTEICLEDNKTFDIKEIMKTGLGVKLTEDTSKLIAIMDVSSVDELCLCYNTNTGSPADCTNEINDIF